MAVLPTISVCAGGARLDLGASAALEPDLSLRPVLYLEREAFSAAYLVDQMESGRLARAPVWSSVESVDERVLEDLRSMARESPAALVSGFPCQPWSSAGKREREDDHRWIWSSIDRIIRMVGPSLVILENVPGVSLGGLQHVLATLAEGGFSAEWDCFTAAEVGAPHRRERWFLVGVSDADRLEVWQEQGRRESGGPRASEYGHARQTVADGHELRRDEGQRDTSPREGEPEPQRGGEVVGDPDSDWTQEQGNLRPRQGVVTGSRPVANSDRRRLSIERGAGGCRHGKHPPGDEPDRCLPRFPPGPEDWRGWLRVLRAGREDLLPRALAEVELEVPVVAYGLADASRVDLLRLGGNGVVPAQAELAVRTLLGRLAE